MELMMLHNIIAIIDKYKRIYPDDYKNIVLENGGVPLRNSLGVDTTLGYVENIIKRHNIKDNLEYIPVLIGDEVLINKYELLDSSTINIHCIQKCFVI